MVEAVEALVGKERLRLRRERPGELELLQRRGAEPVGRAAPVRRQPDRRQRLLGDPPALGARDAAVLAEEGRQRDVLDEAQIAERARDLEGPPDALVADAVRRQPADLGILEPDRAGGRRVEPGDAVEGRALA